MSNRFNLPVRVLKMSKRRKKIAIYKIVHSRLSKMNIVGHTINRVLLDEIKGVVVDTFIYPVKPIDSITIDFTVTKQESA